MLYSKQIYWPNEIETKVKEITDEKHFVNQTIHFKNRRMELNLPYGIWKLALVGEVIECEIINGYVVKLITRVQNKCRPWQDICFAISIEGKCVGIKTVWTNAHLDSHQTIKTGNYVQKPLDN